VRDHFPVILLGKRRATLMTTLLERYGGTKDAEEQANIKSSFLPQAHKPILRYTRWKEDLPWL